MEETKKENTPEIEDTSKVEVGSLVGVPELKEEDKPTEIIVEKPAESEEDVDEVPHPEEYKPAETTKNPKVREKYEEVIKESNKHFLERVKDETFDINKIDFEADGVTPVVTDEDLRVFAAISDEYIGDTDLDVYVQMARESIEDYINQKKEMDAGLLDEDDLEYFQHTANSYEESRLFMASIQHECRKLKKDFEESSILEDTIKSMVYDNLYYFIIDNYKLSDSWIKKEISENDVKENVQRLSKDISKHMFVPTLFQEWIRRENYKIDKSNPERYKFNLFNPKHLDNSIKNIVFTIEHYIKNSNTEPTHLAVEKILDKDLMNLNFVNPILMYAFKDHVLTDKKLTPEQMEIAKKNFEAFESVLIPTEECKKSMKEVSKSITYILKWIAKESGISDGLDDIKIKDSEREVRKEHIEKFKKLAIKCFVSDPLFKQFAKDNNYCFIDENGNYQYKIEDIPFDDVKEMYLKLADIIPNVEDTTIRKWGLSFKFSQKYYFLQHFIEYLKDLETITDAVELEMSAFNNIIIPLCQFIYLIMYADIITDIDNDIVRTYNKENRGTIFGTFINHFIFTHELSFKEPIPDPSVFDFKKKKDADGNETNELDRTPLVDIMHRIFGENYKYMCSEADDPNFEYANFDIRDTRKTYIDTVAYILKYLHYTLTTAAVDFSEFTKYLDNCEVKHKPANKGKKKSKKRRR